MSADDIQIFRADAEDAEGIAAVHASSFEVAYRDVLPEVVERAPDLETRVERWQALLEPDTDAAYTLVAEHRAKAVGFVSLATPSRDADVPEKTAEIAAFYIAPSRWGNGIGTKLLTHALDELRGDGWAAATLWVLVSNEPARTFYAKFGFEADGAAGPDPMTDRPKMRLRVPLA